MPKGNSGIIFALLCCFFVNEVESFGAASDLFPLQISANKRYLTDKNGAPFLWMGDTSWTLFSQVTREQAVTYLDNRQAKGFTVIQSHLLTFNDINGTNVYGQTPFIAGDMTRPNEAYWAHVDWVIDQAGQRGFCCALIMAWAASYEAQAWLTMANARIYGRFLGARYKDVPHVVWLGGGDFGTPSPGLWRELAAGVEEGQGNGSPAHLRLMSFHPRGPGTSSYQFHGDPWEDFDMIQSSVQSNPKYAYETILGDYALTPPKPTLNGEPAYERMLGNYSDNVVRRNSYATFFSGGCGLTYGADPVWNIGGFGWTYSPGSWVANMDFPGAFQMGYLKNLLLYYAWYQAGPDVVLGSVIDPADRGANESYVSSLVSADSSFALIYFPDAGASAPRSVRVLLSRFSGPVYLQWYDPTSGQRTSAGGPFAPTGVRTCTAPGVNFGGDKDWVLEIFTARWINLAPTAAVTSPAPETSFPAPATFTISANASDADGVIGRVEFFIGSTKIGEDPSPPYTFTYPSLGPGDYTLTAKSWDDRFLSGTSAPVYLHVKAPSATSTATVQFTVDNQNTEIYLNGIAAPPGPNKAQWWQPDTFANIANLRSLALKCTNDSGGGAGALIARVGFQNGVVSRSDFGWKVAYSTTGAPPPDDATGRKWYETNYDDRAWETAKSAGLFGIDPWGSADGLSIMAGSNWIWYKDPNNGVSPVYFRKTFGLTPVPPVARIALEGAQVRISWDSVVGTKYRVQFSPDLIAPFVDIATSEMVASSLTSSNAQPMPSPRGFYRVRVVP